MQTLADVTGRPVAVMDGGGEAVGAGAAMLAGVAAGGIPAFSCLKTATATLRAGQQYAASTGGAGTGARHFVPDPAREAVYSQMYTDIYCPTLVALGPISTALAKLQ